MKIKRDFDVVISEIAGYASSRGDFSDEAREVAALSLIDAIGCAVLATSVPRAMSLVDPSYLGATQSGKIPVMGTNLRLDAVRSAFANGTLIRWLDYNDTFLALEWGHPSDNLGAILATAHWRHSGGGPRGVLRLTVGDIISAAIRAHEIQGVLSMSCSLNARGIDHVAYVRIASAALACALLGGEEDEIAASVSQAFVDGATLRCYRHAPNAGSRKSWASGEATSRGVQLAALTLAGVEGYPSAVTAANWGFQEGFLGGDPLRLAQPLGSYVMEKVLLKVPYPAEFHAQSALEAAVFLHGQVAGRLDEIEEIRISTHRSAMRIIAKDGPLSNPADRDHSLQYIVALGLIKGEVSYLDYEDQVAGDPRIDVLRKKMSVVEDGRFSRDYLDPALRSVANSLEVIFLDGTSVTRTVEYPLGHPRRRGEAKGAILEKFYANVASGIGSARADAAMEATSDLSRFLEMDVTGLFSLFVRPDDI